MTDNHKIVKAEVVEIQNDEQPMHPLVKAAIVSGNIDVDKMDKLLDLQERYEKMNAKKAFDRDMVLLKENMPVIIGRDGKTDYLSKKGGRVKYTFASLSNIIEQIEPHLSTYGFSFSWIPSTTDRTVTITCRLTHKDGHFEEATMTGPHDNSGHKNPLQAIGSSQSYLERYTACALLGVVSRDMPDADDPPPPSDVVNQDRNLEAIGILKREGIELSDAQEHLQKDVQHWTEADLTELGKYIRAIREQRETDAQHDLDAQ